MEKSKEKKKKGKVIYKTEGKVVPYDEASCPFCGFKYGEFDNAWMEPYCPHCGAELVW